MMFNLSLNGISQNSEPPQCRPKSFGEVHDNYNWIECASAKNPDQNYYFNVRSHCRTWTRPVPENVDLPFFNPHLVPPQTSENENESSPPVSELDDTSYQDNEEYEEIENQNENEKQIFEIASKLFYHGSQNSRRSRKRIVEDFSEKDSALFETLPITDFLEVQYLSEDSAKRLRSPSPSSSESSEESNTKSSKESTSSSCHCSCCDVPKENSDGDSQSYESSTSYQSLSSNFSAPRVKEITFSDLMTEPRRKLRRRKKCKIEPLTKLTPEKRICDMYGIRTISYDPIFEYINPILPNNVQPTCLTDSSIENSPSRPKDVSNIDWKRLFDLPIHIEDPILSEVSSGSEITEPFEDSEYVKEVSPSKIIWRPWDEKKKSYEDILGGKVLCIKLHRIDLDKDYFGAKNKKTDYQMEKGKEKSTITGKPKESVNKENLNKDNLETEAEEVSEVDERKEDRRHKKKVGRFKKESSEENWEIEEDSLQEANSEIEDSEVEERFPRCLRPKKNTTIYVEPDTDEEYFEDYRHLKFSETIRRTTERSFRERSDTEKESEIEKRDENKNKTTKDTSNDEHSKVHSESEENSKVEERKVKSNNTKENNSIEGNSETEDSEREDSSDENSTGENNQICLTSLEKEGNDNYGWVIVNSETNKMKLKKVLVNSVSTENENIDYSKMNVEEEKTIEVPKVQEKSANEVQENEITDDKIEDLRVDFDRSKVKEKSFEIKDLERPTDIISEDLMLIERSKTLNSFTLVTKELTDSAELKDKEEEIKSQENEIQNGENSMELDEEEEKSFGIKDDRLPEINLENLTEKTRTIYFESLNTTTRELFLQEVNFLESLISSVSPPQANFAELRDKEGEIKTQENKTQIGEKPKEPDEETKKSVEIKDDRPNEKTEKTKPNSFESLNNCKATTRELTLQRTDSCESLTSTLSIQTTSEDSTDTGEEIKSQENEIQTRKKQMELDEKDELLLIEGDQIEEEEKSIDLDEEELLLMEKDQGEDELQSIDLDEEELLLMENDQIESEKLLDLNEDEDEVFIIEKENNKSPEEKLIDPTIGKAGSKTPEAEKPKNFSGIGKKKDVRNKKLPLFEKGNEPEIILIESDNEKEELPLIKNGNKKRRTKKEKNKNVKKKDVDEEELSDTKTCSTLVESNSRSEDEDDDNNTDVDKDQILSETETVIGDGGFDQSSIDSDVTEVCSEFEYD